MAVEATWHVTDLTELKIAYSGSTVVVGFQEPTSLLLVNMSTAQAIHLALELREALKDINTEDAEE